MLGTILIFIYLLASILVGVWASRKETPEGFLLGDRKVGTLSTSIYPMVAVWLIIRTHLPGIDPE